MIFDNLKGICATLSITGATAFHTVKNLLKKNDIGLTIKSRTENPAHPQNNQASFDVLKMKSPEVNPFSGNPLDWKA